MVVIARPATADTGVVHERSGWPSTCTVHAPHIAIPQPYLVPVSSSFSRSTQRSGVSGEASMRCGLPLTVREITGMLSSVGGPIDPLGPCYHRPL